MMNKITKINIVQNTEKFLDWLVELDISFYKTTAESNYIPSGNSHFYLKGSQERFTTKEMMDIFNNCASDTINENWQYAIAENIAWQKKYKH